MYMNVYTHLYKYLQPIKLTNYLLNDPHAHTHRQTDTDPHIWYSVYWLNYGILYKHKCNHFPVNVPIDLAQLHPILVGTAVVLLLKSNSESSWTSHIHTKHTTTTTTNITNKQQHIHWHIMVANECRLIANAIFLFRKCPPAWAWARATCHKQNSYRRLKTPCTKEKTRMRGPSRHSTRLHYPPFYHLPHHNTNMQQQQRS